MASKKFSHSGKVLSINGRKVRVEFSSQGACAGCQASAKCGMVDSSKREVEVVIGPDESYAVGQDVEVAIGYQMGIMSVIVAYVIPLIILIGVLCGATFIGLGEGLAALVTLISIAIYFVIVYIFRSKLDKQIKFTIEK
ncbi:MAG: SoxR reducing system RseC family protein [Rikenellaceae bacterium]